MSKILTFGVYDYFHLGHLRLFKQCKEYADYLVVAVQNGEYIKKFKPEASVLYSTDERVEMLEALRINGVPCELVTFPDSGHSLDKNPELVDFYFERVHEFYKSYAAI